MIELRKYKVEKRMLYIARARSSKRTRTGYIYIRAGGGGGRVYEIKTLRSNLAPEEGGGRLF